MARLPFKVNPGGTSTDMASDGMRILAQQTDTVGVLIWALLLIVLVIALFGAVEGFKRWLRRDHQETGAIGGFTLDELRRMHREGKLSDEEFEATRRRLVAAAQSAAARGAERSSAPRGEPKMVEEPDGSDNNPD